MTALSISMAFAAALLSKFFWDFNVFLAVYYFALAAVSLALHALALRDELSEMEAQRMFAIVMQGSGEVVAYAMSAEEGVAMSRAYATANVAVVNMETGERVEELPRPIVKAGKEVDS